MHNAFAAQLEHLSALRAGGDLQIGFAFESRHMHFAPERRNRERDRDFAIQIIFVALENLVFLHMDYDVEVALGPAPNSGFSIARGPQAGAARDPRWNFQFDSGGLFDAPFPFAGAARLFHDLAHAAATGAGLRDLKKSAGTDDLASPAAGRTADGAGSGLGA